MNGTSTMPFSNSSMCALCPIYPYSYSQSMRTDTTCTEDLRMVSPIPICAQCCSNYGVKVRICVAIVVCCPIPSIKHSAFWHRFNCSKYQIKNNKIALFSFFFFHCQVAFLSSTFYKKLKATLQKPLQQPNGPQKCHENGIEVNGKFFEQNLQQIAHANTTINRFLSAFIDHVCVALNVHCNTNTNKTIFFSFTGPERFGLHYPRENDR